MSNLYLKRLVFTDKSTIGELYIDGNFECYTLEDTCRKFKISGKTAIPAGKYEVIISYSNRFKKDMPLLLRVPNFDGIRIHPGNTDADTNGCILVGNTKKADMIGDSRIAYSELFPKIKDLLSKDKLFISIQGGSNYVA